MTNEAHRAPEILFNPSLVGLEYSGVHECLHNAIMRSDLDLRKTLYSQIVVAGGTTLMRGEGTHTHSRTHTQGTATRVRSCNLHHHGTQSRPHQPLTCSAFPPLCCFFLRPGFGERLLKEIRTLAPKDIKIRITAPQERAHLTWIGGCVNMCPLASTAPPVVAAR